MDKEILISIVIPVKNGEYWLRDTLSNITRQTLFDRCEIIVIDSGSTDNTHSILREFPVELVQIPSKEFNHGATRNLGASRARGKYVVMTVQDASPTDNKWLERLLEGFEDDKVAGVCGQQIVPHDPGMNPLQWFRPISEPEKKTVYFSNPEAFHALSPFEKRAACGWDNVNAMYRKEVLLQIPFRAITFGEDAQWAMDVLIQGYRIVYNPAARVYHYHYEKPDFTFRRVFAEYYAKYRLFGCTYDPENNLLCFLRDVKTLLKENKVGVLSKFRWLAYNTRARRASNKAIIAFNRSIAEGDAKLDQAYSKFCKVSPMAPTPSYKN